VRRLHFTTLGTVLLASALPVVGAVLVIIEHPTRNLNSAPELVQSQWHLDVRTLAGKISQRRGKFVFREEHRKEFYQLDDQQNAQRYSGKEVLVTGILDAQASLVHVHRIEAATRPKDRTE
jgi:hypothetical protein